MPLWEVYAQRTVYMKDDPFSCMPEALIDATVQVPMFLVHALYKHEAELKARAILEPLLPGEDRIIGKVVAHIDTVSEHGGGTLER